jgi:hypothetical protein
VPPAQSPSSRRRLARILLDRYGELGITGLREFGQGLDARVGDPALDRVLAEGPG